MLFHLIGNGPAQHPAFANGIGSLIDQKFRIVFQRGVVNGIWIERLGISKSRCIKYTLGSVQKAYTQIFRSSNNHKMGTILSTDQAGWYFSFAALEDDLHMKRRPVFICSNHAAFSFYPTMVVSWIARLS